MEDQFNQNDNSRGTIEPSDFFKSSVSNFSCDSNSPTNISLNSKGNLENDSEKISVQFSPELDEAFGTLESKLCSTSPKEFVFVLQEYFPVFKQIAFNYYRNLLTVERIQKEFLNKFTPIWIHLLENKLLFQAQKLWEEVLLFAWELKHHYGIEIHQGTIYYYWGRTAIENGELELGYRLMGAALVEDKETYKKAQPDTPAYNFVHFNYVDERQNFNIFIQELKETFLDFLCQYKKLTSSNIDEINIQNKFLASHPNEEAVLLLNYSLARIRQHRHFPEDSPDNQFSGILDLNLFSDIALVIETSLKAKLSDSDMAQTTHKEDNPKYGFLAGELLKKVNKNSKRDKIGDLKKYIADNNNLYCVIRFLINRNFTHKGWGNIKPVEYDILISYLIRNHSAHNIDPNLFLPIFRHNLLQTLFNALFSVIEYDYLR